MIKLIYITNSPDKALIAEKSGVEIIMVDLESNGKLLRQGHLNTRISNHKIDDIKKISENISRAELMVRVNPLNSNSLCEISEAINLGANRLMLPMFTRVADVEKFIGYINGRAKNTLLLETPAAVVRIDQMLSIDGVENIHVGLNDLHIAMNLNFMFEILSGGLLDYLAEKINLKKIPFGFGGVARLSNGLIDPKLILSEHVRLKSTQVILSRDFDKIFEDSPISLAEELFNEEISLIRREIIHLNSLEHSELLNNSSALKKQVASLET
jgi:hypothetical protein